ncbi:MAG: glycoside hydrolase domain-containing protein [Gemmatimonadaceae bacterium]
MDEACCCTSRLSSRHEAARNERTWRISVHRCIAALSVALAATCNDARSPTSPPPPPAYAGYPGFDISHYPGDAALAAWRFPASPYHWVDYYRYAPCHRDSTWMGSYDTVKAMGWGTAVLYVGQQDWSMIPSSMRRARRSFARPDFDRTGGSAALAALAASAASTTVTCSAFLLTSAQGTSEAADAVAKMAGEGVPSGSAIFLDVEYVPMAAYAAAGRHDAPHFRIASSRGFAITNKPTDVGLEYANVWQGVFEVRETWGGFTSTIDVDVADSQSPSQIE